jgi:hypothetical protein
MGPVCPACGAQNEQGQWACTACNASFVRQYDLAARPTRCPVCAGDLEHGEVQVRTGAGPGIGVLIDAGMMWSFLPLSTATCVRCGHVDLYAK